MSTENPDRDEDSRLVEQIQAGDTGAYRQLVEKYQGRIYSLIAGMVRDREEAHDLTQDAFVKAFKNLDRFRLESSFYTWLYRIAKNLTIDWLRKQRGVGRKNSMRASRLVSRAGQSPPPISRKVLERSLSALV